MHKPILLFAALALAAAPAAAQLAPQYGTTPQSQAAFRAYIQQRDQLEEIQREIARTQAQIRALEAQQNSSARGSDCFARGMAGSGALGYTAPFLSGQMPSGLAAGLAGGVAGCN